MNRISQDQLYLYPNNHIQPYCLPVLSGILPEPSGRVGRKVFYCSVIVTLVILTVFTGLLASPRDEAVTGTAAIF